MNYIITEKLTNDIRTAIRLGCDGTLPNENELMDAIYSCPYNPQSEREKVLDKLIDETSERIKELKQMPATKPYEDCMLLALVGENQSFWARLKELREVKSGE